MSGEYVRHSWQFKREALGRMETCRNVSALAPHLGVRRKILHEWKQNYSERGDAGLRSRAEREAPAARRPKTSAPAADPGQLSLEARVAELERQLGTNQLEVEFLTRTFEQVRGALDQHVAGGGAKFTTASVPGSRPKNRA